MVDAEMEKRRVRLVVYFCVMPTALKGYCEGTSLLHAVTLTLSYRLTTHRLVDDNLLRLRDSLLNMLLIYHYKLVHLLQENFCWMNLLICSFSLIIYLKLNI